MSRRYLFADESGNVDFSRGRGATRFFATITLSIDGDDALASLRSDLFAARTELSWRGVGHGGEFHASEDAQAVRDVVFDVIRAHPLRADVTVFEKAKAQPHLYQTPTAFFAYAWREHLARVAPEACDPGDELLVSLAAVGTRRLRASLRVVLDEIVASCAPKVIPRSVFVPSAADPALQAADYVLWAVMRSWERGDDRAVDLVRDLVRSQHDHFARGSVHYY